MGMCSIESMCSVTPIVHGPGTDATSRQKQLAAIGVNLSKRCSVLNMGLSASSGCERLLHGVLSDGSVRELFRGCPE